MGEGPKNVRDDERFDPRTRGEQVAGRRDEEISGRAMDERNRTGTPGSTPGGTTSGTGRESAPSTSEIRSEIEQTRAAISGTVDAIQHKLSPGNLMSKAKSSVGEATRTKARRVVDAAEQTASQVADTTRRVTHRAVGSARENPWPTAAAFAGAGALAWWLVNRRHRDDEIIEFADSEDLPVEAIEEDVYLDEEFEFDEDGGRRWGTGAAVGVVPLAIAGAGLGYWLWSQRAGRGERMGAFPANPDAWADAGGYGADAGSYRSFEEAGEDWRSGASDASSRMKDAVSGAADRARQAVSSTRTRARGALDEVRSRTRDIASKTSGQVSGATHRARSQFESMTRERPLAVSAAALALGVAVGMAVPISRTERRLMGPARDRLVQRARGTAREAIGNMKQTLKETVEQVTERAKEAMNEASRGSMDEGSQGRTS
jgi:ElaB/YqjD/DUF883 family membrane-anchored ribosome-binding protein